MIEINPYELSAAAVHGYGALQKIPEFAGLLDLVDQGQPKIIMEIGAGNGGTSWAWSKLSSVDVPGGNWGGRPDIETVMANIQEVTEAKIIFIGGNSQNAECLAAVKLALLKEDNTEEKIDFLFIDGDHSYNGVKADFITYKGLVKDEGLIAFHDIHEHPPESGCEVKKFWDELKSSGIPEDHYCELIAFPDEHWGGIGAIKVPAGGL
jgi:cephalosporin hydroxylase